MVVEHSVTEVVLFCVLIIVCLWCDLHAHQADKPVSARNAAIWSCIWVGLALVFAGYIGYSFGSEQVQLFLTGYLLEKSLSVDNLFVIMAIFSSFAVKDAFQHRVLYYGVLGALVLRLIFVAAGSSLVAMFGPYALASFGIFVLWTAWKMWQSMHSGEKEEIVDYSEHWATRDYTLDAENIKCPALIVHGLNDDNVRTKEFDLMYQAYQKAGVNVMVVPDVTPYKKRKVRILNGAHTGFVLGAYLAGFDIVRDCMHNDTVRGFMNKMLHEEIIPTLPLDKKDLEEFASAVEDRFNNPFVNHELMSISLNSTSKWKARNMPSFLSYIEEQKQLPKCLTMSLAAYIAFYSNDIQERTADGLICKRPAGNTYKIQDDAWALDFYFAHKDDTAAELVHAVLTNTQMWDQDLTKIEGLEAAVLADLELIRTQGAEAAYKSCL